MAKQNYPKGRNRYDQGGGRNRYDQDEWRKLVERNYSSIQPSAAESVAKFWPMAIIPACLVTFGLWYEFIMVRETISWRIAVFAGIATAFVLNSLFTIWFYKTDKRLAELQHWRIPEASLHFWEFFCGWPGALYAQRKYRHKWKKTSFMVVFWVCVILNVTVVLGVAFPEYSLPLLRYLDEVQERVFGYKG